MIKRIGGAGAALAMSALLLGCNSVDREDTLAEAGAEDADARQDIIESFAGILTEEEAGCLADTVLASEDVEVGELIDFASSPAQSGPVFELYRTAFTTCVDPALDLPPVPIEGEQREQFEAGIRSTAPNVTDEQVQCVLDSMAASGLGVRELIIAGYLPDQAAALQEGMAAAATCLTG